MYTTAIRIIGLILVVTAMWGQVPWYGWLGLLMVFLKVEKDGWTI